jgi:uncharacterized protein YkwD
MNRRTTNQRIPMTTRASLIICISLLALGGCGGGGGGTSAVVTPPVTVTPTPPVPTPVDQNELQATAPAPTYAANSASLSAFNTLNGARGAYGVGVLVQNTMLDTAGMNHSLYNMARWQAADYAAVGHIEDSSKSGFTGVTPADRILAAKYLALTTSEAFTNFISVSGVASDPGVVAINVLLSGPYHRFTLFGGHREVGIGTSTGTFPNEGGVNNFVNVEMAVPQAKLEQLPGQSWVGLWPTDKAVNVMYGFAGESPDPIPSLKGACGGYPVSLQVRSGTVLNTTAFTLVETQSGAPVSVQLSTAATDANPSSARTNSVYIIPLKPLKLATQYTARFTGSTSNGAIDKTWTFTTVGSNTKLIYGCDPS